jgi:hypothetical protein
LPQSELEPRWHVGFQLKEAKAVSAMIDIADALEAEADHLPDVCSGRPRLPAKSPAPRVGWVGR